MAQRCWRLTWPTRSDRLLNAQPQVAHMHGKDCVGRAKGEGAWSDGENGGREGEEEAVEGTEGSERRAWIDWGKGLDWTQSQGNSGNVDSQKDFWSMR